MKMICAVLLMSCSLNFAPVLAADARDANSHTQLALLLRGMNKSSVPDLDIQASCKEPQSCCCKVERKTTCMLPRYCANAGGACVGGC